MANATLVLNAGSSSLKFAMFEQVAGLPSLIKGGVSSLEKGPRLKVSNSRGELAKDEKLGSEPIGIPAALGFVFNEISERGLAKRISTIGHRIVHGGHEWKDGSFEHWFSIHGKRNMRIGIATDHGGFSLKEELVKQLREAGHDVEIVDYH